MLTTQPAIAFVWHLVSVWLFRRWDRLLIIPLAGKIFDLCYEGRRRAEGVSLGE